MIPDHNGKIAAHFEKPAQHWRRGCKMRKRFVKLLLFKVDTQYRLLYGFSSETEQSSYLWKAFPADKKGQKLIVKAILSPSEADNFSINLTGTEPIMLSNSRSQEHWESQMRSFFPLRHTGVRFKAKLQQSQQRKGICGSGMMNCQIRYVFAKMISLQSLRP